MAINVIQGTDREFTIRIIRESTQEPFDFTGFTGSDLELTLPGENTNLVLSLTPNGNGSGLSIVSAAGGKIKVTLDDADTVSLKARDSQDMELKITDTPNGGDISKVQILGELSVQEMLFS